MHAVDEVKLDALLRDAVHDSLLRLNFLFARLILDLHDSAIPESPRQLRIHDTRVFRPAQLVHTATAAARRNLFRSVRGTHPCVAWPIAIKWVFERGIGKRGIEAVEVPFQRAVVASDDFALAFCGLAAGKAQDHIALGIFQLGVVRRVVVVADAADWSGLSDVRRRKTCKTLTWASTG